MIDIDTVQSIRDKMAARTDHLWPLSMQDEDWLLPILDDYLQLRREKPENQR